MVDGVAWWYGGTLGVVWWLSHLAPSTVTSRAIHSAARCEARALWLAFFRASKPPLRTTPAPPLEALSTRAAGDGGDAR